MRFSLPLSLGALLLPLAAVAQSPVAMDADEVSLQLRGDLYVAGNAVSPDAYSGGDLNIVGSSVVIDRAISGDLQAAGSTVSINADVAENVRAAGGTVSVSGDVNGNLVVFGGTVTIARGVTIRGDLVVGGGDVTVSGAVEGNVRAYADTLTLEGPVGGTLQTEAEHFRLFSPVAGDAKVVSPDWHLADGAMFRNDLTYWHSQPEAAFNLDEYVAGTATYDADLRVEKEAEAEAAGALAAILGAVSVYAFLSAALVMGLLMLLTRTYFRDAAARLEKEPWLALLFGFLFFVVTPALALLFAMTFVGLPVTLLLLAYFFFALLFAKPFTAVVLARYVERRAKAKWSGWLVWLLALGLYLVLKLLMVVPFVGWLIVMLAIFLAFGAMMMTKYDKYVAVR